MILLSILLGIIVVQLIAIVLYFLGIVSRAKRISLLLKQQKRLHTNMADLSRRAEDATTEEEFMAIVDELIDLNE